MTSCLRRRGFLAAAGALLAGCSTGDPRPGTGATEETPRVSATPTSTGGVETRWDTFVPGQYALAAPAVVDGRLFLGSREEMRALDTDDGAVTWEAPLGALTHAFSPAVADDVVYAGARNMVGRSLLEGGEVGTVAALAADDGGIRWRTDARITGPPTVASEAVFVPTADDDGVHVRALARADGRERWHTTIADTGGAFAPVVVAEEGERALAATTGDAGGRLVALDLVDGTEAWGRGGEGFDAAPAVADGIAYAGARDGAMQALDVATGREHWQVDLDGHVETQPVVAGDAVYVAVDDEVRALAREEGHERWRTAVGDLNDTGLAVAGGRVYAGGVRLSALSADDGGIRWVQRLQGMAGTFGAPVPRDGVLYTGACIKKDGDDPYDHHVYALVEPE